MGMDTTDQQLGRANFVRAYRAESVPPGIASTKRGTAPATGQIHAVRPDVSRRGMELRKPSHLRSGRRVARHSHVVGADRFARGARSAGDSREPRLAEEKSLWYSGQ